MTARPEPELDFDGAHSDLASCEYVSPWRFKRVHAVLEAARDSRSALLGEVRRLIEENALLRNDYLLANAETVAFRDRAVVAQQELARVVALLPPEVSHGK